MEKYVIGIDAGGTKVAYGLFDGEGRLADKMRHSTDERADGPGFSDTLLEGVRCLMEKNRLGFDALKGVGVCMPSFILYDEGRIMLTSAMPGIKDFPMLDYLKARLPVRVALDNDSNAAALAEYRHGAGRGARHMVYMAFGTGLGSGIIIDGRLFQGSYGWAGECGHMLATPDEGIMCGCENRGCFMSYASGRYLPVQARLRLDKGAESALKNGEIDGMALERAYLSGDRLAEELVKEMAHYLAVCVFNVYQVLNINTFVFGGGLVSMGEPLLKLVREEFDRYNHIKLPVYFKTAELQRDFGIIGAAEFIKEA